MSPTAKLPETDEEWEDWEQCPTHDLDLSMQPTTECGACLALNAPPTPDADVLRRALERIRDMEPMTKSRTWLAMQEIARAALAPDTGSTE